MAFLKLFDVLQCVRPVGEVWLHIKYEGSSNQISSKLSRVLLLRVEVALRNTKPGAQEKHDAESSACRLGAENLLPHLRATHFRDSFSILSMALIKYMRDGSGEGG